MADIQNDSSRCRACEDDELELFLNLGKMPLAGGFLSSVEEIASEVTYSLQIFTCRSCSLVQIVDPIDHEILFQDYSFSSSTIPQLVRHFNDYAEWITRRVSPTKVVEFGCNDGVLLQPLRALDIEAVGVDVSKNITDIARSKGLNVVTGFFDQSCASDLVESFGQVDLVTGSNAFAHNSNPGEILEAARRVLKSNGHLSLEFMYAGDLLELCQWDTLYHEHLTFYSLGTIEGLLDRYGFHITHVERIPMHGGSLRLLATRATDSSEDASVEGIRRYEEEMKLNDPRTWKDFGQAVDRKIAIVKDVMANLSQSRVVWAYGAAGKATMWVNACDMHYLGAVVDASPLRAGKLMPGTHTPIVLPEVFRTNPPDHVFVTAWNYADDIRSNEDWFLGTWSTPLPELRFF